MIKTILGILLLLVISPTSSADENGDGFDAGSTVLMMKASCEGKFLPGTDQERLKSCVMYHEFMESYYSSLRIQHSVCAKKPNMDICKELRHKD